MEPQRDPIQEALKAKIAELEQRAVAAKQRGADDLASIVAFGVQHCTICHNHRKANHKADCTGPCKNWLVTSDGTVIDICGYPNDERKRKGHEDRALQYKAEVLKKRLEKKETESVKKNATKVSTPCFESY